MRDCTSLHGISENLAILNNSLQAKSGAYTNSFKAAMMFDGLAFKLNCKLIFTFLKRLLVLYTTAYSLCSEPQGWN